MGLNKVTRGSIRVRDGDGDAGDGRCVPTTICGACVCTGSRWCFSSSGCFLGGQVEENVGLGLELRGVPKEERRRIVEEKLKLVQLDKWADKYAHELSGGMQQRVGLARAFATDADLAC